MSLDNFDENWYTKRYPDVKDSGLTPREHYQKLGRKVGRFPHAPTFYDYIKAYSFRIWSIFYRLLIAVIKRMPFIQTKVDESWYLENNPDVSSSHLSAQDHYRFFGKKEGRLPCPPENLSPFRIFILVFDLVAQENSSYQIALSIIWNQLRKSGYKSLKNWVAHVYHTRINIIGISYHQWIADNELTSDDFHQAQQELGAMPMHPLISVVMPVYNPSLEWLDSAIQSLIAQPYENWELCIAEDASTDHAIQTHLKEWCVNEKRIKVVFREKNGHISEASNSALNISTGEWIALMDQDDLLHPFAFYWVIKAINTSPEAQLIYSDEDKIDIFNKRFMPYFKPDWNCDLFLGQNCFSHLGLIKNQLAKKIGGFRKGYEGSQDHDLILRAIEQVQSSQIFHIPKILYHWRAHEHSTAQSGESKPYAAIAGEKAVNDYLKRNNIAADAEYYNDGYRVKYQLPTKLPLVSLIIPTRNGLQLIKQCIESIEEKTLYRNFEFIIVDNGSDDTDALAYFDTLKRNPNFTVLRDDRPFNYSQLNNLAARYANGDILGLINNDIEVISPEWLGEMVSHCLRPGVGAVGAKLLYPDGRLQHGGVILGVGGVANHAHLFIDKNSPGYFARANLIQQFSAVTAACLLVKKSIYQEAGGLDETNLAVAFNDVDFCIRLGKLGYRNIWTPHALLYHHESATRGEDIAPEKRARFVSEVNYMMQTWGQEFVSDPAYNPNLNLQFPNFSLSTEPRLGKWDLSFDKTSLAHTSDATN